MRALIIDDDKRVRLTLRLILEAEGHTVDEAEDGEVGLALTQKKDFDFVITDVVMPNKEGLEILMELNAEKPDLPVIVISGGGRISDFDYLEPAEGLGAAATLAKPFTKEELTGAIEQALSRA